MLIVDGAAKIIFEENCRQKQDNQKVKISHFKITRQVLPTVAGRQKFTSLLLLLHH
jgi:hypothetical protein